MRRVEQLMIRLTGLCIALVVVSAPAFARGGGGSRGFSYGTGSKSSSTYVAPHTNRNGSTTSGHYRTTPDGTRSNNYGSSGNVNPFTGGVGNGYGHSKP